MAMIEVNRIRGQVGKLLSSREGQFTVTVRFRITAA